MSADSVPEQPADRLTVKTGHCRKGTGVGAAVVGCRHGNHTQTYVHTYATKRRLKNRCARDKIILKKTEDEM